MAQETLEIGALILIDGPPNDLSAYGLYNQNGKYGIVREYGGQWSADGADYYRVELVDDQGRPTRSDWNVKVRHAKVCDPRTREVIDKEIKIEELPKESLEDLLF